MSSLRRCGLSIRARCLRLGLVALLAIAMMLGLIAPIFSQTTYTITLYPIADARVTSQNPNTNYGAETTARLFLGSAGTYILFKFNLTEVITQQMPNLRFYLKVYAISRTGSYFGKYFRVHPYPNDWHESNVTWNNKPASISYNTRIAHLVDTSVVPPAWATFDITDYVAGNCLNSVCSFALVYAVDLSSDTSISTSQYYDFATKEYSDSSKWPHLLIQYSALTTVTQTLTVTSTETRTTTRTTTETLTAVELATTTVFTVIGTAYETVTQTITTYFTETETSTATITDIIYALAYTTRTSTITTTLTNLIMTTTTQTQTTTMTQTAWASPVTTTITRTITPTFTEYVTETAEGSQEGGLDLNQIMIAIMAIGLVISILGVLLRASGGD